MRGTSWVLYAYSGAQVLRTRRDVLAKPVLCETEMEPYSVGISRPSVSTSCKSGTFTPVCRSSRLQRQIPIRTPHLRRSGVLATAAGLGRDARQRSRQDHFTLSVRRDPRTPCDIRVDRAGARSGAPAACSRVRSARRWGYGLIHSCYRKGLRQGPETGHRNDPRHGRCNVIIRRERYLFPGGEKGGAIAVDNTSG